MKIEIADYCIRCGICEDMFPNLFKRNYEDHCFDVLVDEITPELEEEAKQAVAECAVAAIKII
ncbi:MAG: ferredoxin [Lachnospiraceae bacterium]|nr:ferredoxin [Lachnospiraceae bacterium]